MSRIVVELHEPFPTPEALAAWLAEHPFPETEFQSWGEGWPDMAFREFIESGLKLDFTTNLLVVALRGSCHPQVSCRDAEIAGALKSWLAAQA